MRVDDEVSNVCQALPPPVLVEDGGFLLRGRGPRSRRAGGSLTQALEPRLEDDISSGRMLIQMRGGGGGNSTSVECLFSVTPLPGR